MGRGRPTAGRQGSAAPSSVVSDRRSLVTVDLEPVSDAALASTSPVADMGHDHYVTVWQRNACKIRRSLVRFNLAAAVPSAGCHRQSPPPPVVRRLLGRRATGACTPYRARSAGWIARSAGWSACSGRRIARALDAGSRALCTTTGSRRLVCSPSRVLDAREHAQDHRDDARAEHVPRRHPRAISALSLAADVLSGARASADSSNSAADSWRPDLWRR